MRLPHSAHTSQPWRIHELTRDFRLEDVWAMEIANRTVHGVLHLAWVPDHTGRYRARWPSS